VGVRDRDRPFEDPTLFEPGRARHLSIPIESEPRAKDRIGARATSWMNDGHPGAHGAATDDEPSGARDECRVTDFDAGDVGDGVERAGSAADQSIEAQIARTECLRRRRPRNGRTQYQSEENSFGCRSAISVAHRFPPRRTNGAIVIGPSL
jgi:hypothetical protein